MVNLKIRKNTAKISHLQRFSPGSEFFSLLTVNLVFDEDMNQSENSIDFFHPCYDCQSNINTNFLNYSGNVY